MTARAMRIAATSGINAVTRMAETTRRSVLPRIRMQGSPAKRGCPIVSRGRSEQARFNDLFDGDGLREVSRLIDVVALQVRHEVREELEREHREEREHLVRGRGEPDDVLGHLHDLL